MQKNSLICAAILIIPVCDFSFPIPTSAVNVTLVAFAATYKNRYLWTWVLM